MCFCDIVTNIFSEKSRRDYDWNSVTNQINYMNGTFLLCRLINNEVGAGCLWAQNNQVDVFDNILQFGMAVASSQY